jgi:exosortase
LIFVTVGTQLPFDRLVEAVDHWAREAGRGDVFAQTGGGSFTPRNMDHAPEVSPAECRRHFEQAAVVVAHAGMGSIITALELGKPIVIMPRLAEHREHRNDHQVATCERFESLPNVFVARRAEEIPARIEAALASPALAPAGVDASGELLEVIKDFLASNEGDAKGIDGIICFGGVDWWYHNRGHYDIQMMREFSRRLPVVYVNSIGMRTPRVGEGAMFAKRVARKVRSWSRGLRLVRENFAVLSPVSIPRFHSTPIARALLADQVRDAADWMGMRRPLVWVACPPAAEVLDRLPAAAVVYQRTDRFEHFPGVNEERIRGYDLALKEKANLTLYCSTSVFEDEVAECRAAEFVDHGVDFEAFAAAGDSAMTPGDVKPLPRPRIGFVGGIDAHTFDPDLFLEVAGAMTDCSFVMVGGCSLPEGWCTLANVHFLGRKPYEEVASYMASCDVLIMPWNRSPWIKACNPVKMKEYLAVGKPVVSTQFDELSRYDGFISVAREADDFVAAIRDALDSPPSAQVLRERVQQETWPAKADAVADALERVGVPLQALPKAAADGEVGLAAIAKGQKSGDQESVDQKPGHQEPGHQEPGDPGDAIPVTAGAAEPPAPKSSYWKPWHFAAATAMALLGAWVTWDAWADIFYNAQRDEESSHIWLVLPVALWLAWVRKEQVHLATRSYLLFGPLVVAVGWLLYSVGDMQLYQSMWHLGAIMVAAGAALSILGGNLFVRIWPAFAVLPFMVPVPGRIRQQIALPLQDITAQVSAFVLETIGFELSLSGNVLVINEVPVAVADACNGLRMVFALALVCFLYAFGTEMRAPTRIFILLISPVLAIGVNVVRLIPTVWFYGYTDMATADMFHDISGWVMIPLALVILIGGGSVVRWAMAPGTNGKSVKAAPAASGA